MRGSRSFCEVSVQFRQRLLVAVRVLTVVSTIALNGITAPIGPYLNGVFPPQAPTNEFGLVDAFPSLDFPQTVQLVPVPRRAKLAVVVKAGRIDVIDANPNASSKTVALDLRSRTNETADGGLLGIAFHPNFGLAGAIGERSLYVYYRYTPNVSYSNRELAYNRLSRFDMDPNTLVAANGSEQVLFQQFDLHTWHNGGCLRFGVDGFLYISVGDMGAPEVSAGSQQQIDKYLLSGVLRIDVNQDPARSHSIRRQPQTPPGLPTGWPNSFSQGYGIPNDNPWLSTSGAYLEEFYAIGIRSPHRMAFDPVTNELWLGDTGYTTSEDISVVRRGDNLQWPYREGNSAKSATPAPLIGVERVPVYSYPSGAVIGGYVYRGTRHATLNGKYLYVDFNSRAVFALVYSSSTDTWASEPVVRFADNGISMGLTGLEDIGDGHIYVLGFGQNGKIFRLEPLPPPAGGPPASLAEVHAFSDLLTLAPVEGLIEYGVNTPLWSDRAEKHRWLALPNDGSYDTATEQIEFAQSGAWRFPAGTVFVKHFELPLSETATLTSRLETRFLIIGDNQTAYGLTYRWNDEGTNAYLISGSETRDLTITDVNGAPATQTWNFPSQQQCLDCHTSGAGYALGWQTWQLNRLEDGSGGSNQLLGLLQRGIFSNPFAPEAIDALPRGYPLNDASISPGARIHSYLAANCSHCHLPGGVASAFDARFENPLDQVLGLPTESHKSTQDFLVTPGDRWNSELYIRDASLGNGAMPPLAKSIVDAQYTDLLGNWIDALDGVTCTSQWLAQTSLRAVSASSEDLPNHRARDAFDNLSATVWHTAWRTGFIPPPHEIVVDLGGFHAIDGISYLPRQDASVSGIVVEFALYLSDDGSSWGEPVLAGSWPGTKQQQISTFPSVQGRFAKFVSLRQLADDPVAVVAELSFRASTCTPDDDPTSSSSTVSSIASTTGSSATSDTSTSTDPSTSSTASATSTISDTNSTIETQITSTSSTSSECIASWAPTTDWSVVYVDSEDLPANEAERVFDGSIYTVWHTSRATNATSLPHELVIDLGSEQLLDAFSYLPRQDASVSGMIRNFEFHVSSDLAFAEAAVVTGTFTTGKQPTTTPFSPRMGRYVKLIAQSEYGVQGRTVVAELGVRNLQCAAVGDSTSTATSDPASSSQTSSSSIDGSSSSDEGTTTMCVANWVPTDAWAVAYVDSEDAPAHLGSHVFDGRAYTVWHTSRAVGASGLPHEIVIDIGSEHLLDAFSYLPRQDTSISGMVKTFSFYVSNSMDFTGAPTVTGEFDTRKQATVVSFSPSRGRYIRLVSTSEFGPSGRTVIAELGVRGLECDPNTSTHPTSTSTASPTSTSDDSTSSPPTTTTPCVESWAPSSDWSIAYVDSEDAPANLAEQAFDGRPFTVWHTSRATTAPSLPHEIVIDLASPRVINAFSYLPRQDASISGMVRNYAFYVSSDLDFDEPPVATGTFDTRKQATIVPFIEKDGRYVRLVATSEYGSLGRTVIAELGVRNLACP